MNRLIGLFAALALACFAASLATPANAQERPFYARAEVGLVSNTEVGDITLADDNSFGAYVGTTVGPFRVEAGASRISADTAGLNLHAWDVNATVYADFQPFGDNTSFFVGAGPDYVSAEANYYYGNYETSGYGWHATAGAAHRFGGVIGEVSARYISTDLDDVGDASAVVYSVGVRVPV